ncbi:MAG: HAMP domain-containing sensor histidine kinase [Cyanobacteria bacterium J06598_1]
MQLIASPPKYPTLGMGNQKSLGIHSVLRDLPLHSFTVTADCSLRDLVDHFTRAPNLPGVIVTGVDPLNPHDVKLLSRQQCLDCLLHTAKVPHFIDSPVCVVLKQPQQEPLTMAGNVDILSAAQQALRRPIDRQSEPIIVVQREAVRPEAAVEEGAEEHAEQTYRVLDANALNVAHWHIRGIETQIRYERLQMQILESEKMASLGRLVDGVAHEILDPVSFIWGNLSYIANYAKQQHELLMAYEAVLPEPSEEILALKEEIEIDYLRSDLPAAIKSARGGAHRLRQLATSLQNFCHIDAVHPRPTDLNTLIDSTLRLLRSRLTTPITIEHSYGKLPPVPCFSGQLSQVFMNIFTNTIDALLSQVQMNDYDAAAAVDPAKPLQITVTTCVCADQLLLTGTPEESRWVSIIISDNGPGIPPETKAQILESFSTKSRYRKETGLAMSYRIVTAKHGGKFWLRSVHASEDVLPEAAQTTGTEFEILLPLTMRE